MTDQVQLTVSAKDMRLLGKALRVYRGHLADRLVVAMEGTEEWCTEATDHMSETVHACRTLHRTLSIAYDDVFEDGFIGRRRPRLP